jgi:hypothetical protein
MATLAKRLSRVLLFAACTLVVARLACVRSFAEDRDAHVERLLAQLTLEEKIQQLQAFRQNGIARLGIPRLPVGETLHGLLGERGTSFPQAIALGSTWDPELIERVATAIAREARAAGVLHAFPRCSASPRIRAGDASRRAHHHARQHRARPDRDCARHD